MGLCAPTLIHFFISSFCFQLYFSTQNPSQPADYFNQSLMDSPSQPNGDHRSTSQLQTDTNRPNHRISSSLGSTNFIGKHRLAAIISQQNQQIQIIQEELHQLETLGEASLVCEQLISSVESSTDALLPVTKGPADGGWDRWFQRATQSSRNHKRWI